MSNGSLLVPAIAVFIAIIGFGTWPFIAIFIHELDHVIAARLVGLTPTQLIIGRPDESEPLFSFRCFDCTIECWPLPFGGATLFATFSTDRFKIFVMAIVGPIIDGLVIFVCLVLWQHTFSFLRVGLAPIIVSQTINVLPNLVPVSPRYAGIRVPSDGKVILQVLARKYET